MDANPHLSHVLLRMAEQIKYDTHVHTVLCKHAEGTMDEYALCALDKGLSGIIFTCHNPMPEPFSDRVRMRPDQMGEYIAMVRNVASRFSGKLDIRLGLECDFFPGYEPYLADQIISNEFYYVLGAVHPQLEDYCEAFWRGNPIDFQIRYFDDLARSAETGLFDCIAHPDTVKIYTENNWNIERLVPHIESCLDRIALTGIAMELNTSGLYKKFPEMHPSIEMLKMMRERNIPVIVGSDAHRPEHVGRGFGEALEMLNEAGYETTNLHSRSFALFMPIRGVASS